DREHALRRALGRERPALRHQRSVREPAVALVPHRGDSSSLIGGLLVQKLSPAGALHGAALIAGIAPLMIGFGTWVLVRQEERSVDLPELKLAARSLIAAVRIRSLWIVALFLFLYSFSPAFHTPLYYHMTDILQFSQSYIGILGAISSAGSICGALIYKRCLA